MYSLKTYIDIIVNSSEEIRTEIGADKSEFYEKFIAQYLQQLNEKIDRIRECAGRCLQEFFKFTVPKVQVDFSNKD